MSEFRFTSAVRENTPIVMALAGASGSGKTYTALELATGLAGTDGKIAVIDTEGRRALHYADLRDSRTGVVRFHFDHCEMRPPFEPARFLGALQAAERSGYRVVLIDSFSDEHEGEGGLIDMAAAGRNPNTAANWAKPKAEHKKIVRWLRQARCHVIFCLRAEERVKLERIVVDGREKSVVTPLGWMPICEKRFNFEMTASFLLDPAHPGIPQPIKLQEQHRRFFPDGPITRDSGRLLAEWADGGAAATSQPPSLAERARDAAENGLAALESFWVRLSRADKLTLRPQMDALKRTAAEANGQEEDDPFAATSGKSSAPEVEQEPPPTADLGQPEAPLPDDDGQSDPDGVETEGADGSSPSASDPAPAEITRIEIHKPAGQKPDWRRTQQNLIGAFVTLKTIDACDRLRRDSSATIQALRTSAPDLHESFEEIAGSHERAIRGAPQ